LLHRVHFTYSYQVNGSDYTGQFDLLAGNTISVKDLQQSMVRKRLEVKYHILRPEVSLISEEQVVGRRVLQGPIWTYR
jgi:hypothetical protein